jgi:hypothetical protein
VQRVVPVGLGQRRPVLGATEAVAPVAQAARPRREQLATKRAVVPPAARPVEQLAAVDRPGLQRRADRIDDQP